jgi:hypothetical protein
VELAENSQKIARNNLHLPQASPKALAKNNPMHRELQWSSSTSRKIQKFLFFGPVWL